MVIEEPPVEDEKEREMGTVKVCLIATVLFFTQLSGHAVGLFYSL